MITNEVVRPSRWNISVSSGYFLAADETVLRNLKPSSNIPGVLKSSVTLFCNISSFKFSCSSPRKYDQYSSNTEKRFGIRPRRWWKPNYFFVIENFERNVGKSFSTKSQTRQRKTNSQLWLLIFAWRKFPFSNVLSYGNQTVITASRLSTVAYNLSHIFSIPLEDA